MSRDDQDRLTEEMAERLWKRAAELQVESARRAEAMARSEAHSELEDSDDSGYALEQVRAAAVEAGIATEFVEAALSELTAELPEGSPETSMWDGLAERILGPSQGPLHVRRDIQASPEEVSKALQRTLLSAPYGLSLRDARGDLLNGGVMTFDIPAITGFAGHTHFQHEASWASMKQLMISIHPTGPDSCQLVVRSPMGYSRRLSGGIGGAVTGAASIAGGVVGLAIGIAIGEALGVPGGSFVAVAGGLTSAFLGAGTAGGAIRALFRKLFNYGQRRSTKAMEGLTGAISTTFVVGWGGGEQKSTIAPDTPQGLLGDSTE
jgi:hypothetical protein